MKRNLRILKGAVVILVACAACCALPVLVAGGISGVLAGELAVLAGLNGWLAGAAIAAAVLLAGAAWLRRSRQRRASGKSGVA